MNGVVLHITGAFTLSNFGFSPIGANNTATPCNWGNTGTTCNTDKTAGNWAIAVVLELNTPPKQTTTYTISYVLPGGGTGFCYGICGFKILSFSVPSTATASSTSGFELDTGSTVIPSTQTVTIIVA